MNNLDSLKLSEPLASVTLFNTCTLARRYWMWFQEQTFPYLIVTASTISRGKSENKMRALTFTRVGVRITDPNNLSTDATSAA